MNLSNQKIREQQRCLAALTLYRGPIDGDWGPKSETAKQEFLELEPSVTDETFTSKVREKVFAIPVNDYQQPADLADTVRKVCQALHQNDRRIWAYIMATVQHETADSFYPVAEAFYVKDDRARRRYLNSKPYSPYYGRGLVQLTWKYNYEKYADILKLPLVDDPDLALEPAISLFILIHGMLTGTYTGHSLNRYIHAHHCDYQKARKVVNGMDKAALIAGYAQKWEQHYV